MIPRYSPPEMAALFTDQARVGTWIEIELLVLEALASKGVVPAQELREVRRRAPVADATFLAAVAERESVTGHDVAAFVDVLQSVVGEPAARWIHFGLTSSDLVDTALSLTLTKAADLLLGSARSLQSALAARAAELIDVPVAGRTHGMQAEPTTFGVKFALFALQVGRDLERLLRARQGIAVGKLSGAVGTYTNIDPAVEAAVCHSLGLEPTPATQVIARDRHAEYLYACASVGATIEAIALEVRHLARSEVGEVEEPFTSMQKGSSAMPHKRNPVRSERLCGIARLLRAYAGAGLEDVALWHERDISQSSVERVALPDASQLACFALNEATAIVSGLVVHAQRARDNMTDLVYSQSVLLALVTAGLSRDAAYRTVQRDARAAAAAGRAFRSVLEEDPEVPLTRDDLDQAFDLERLLRHRRRFLDALGPAGA